MKKTQIDKFPHSSALFSFCQKVLTEKQVSQTLMGKKPKKIIDQRVGELLEFDPADCSHWKKGKKEIKSLFALKSIANRFQMEEETVIAVAKGTKNPKDGAFDYRGYDRLKKESISKESLLAMEQVVLQVLAKAKIQEAPIKMAEVCVFFPQVSLAPELEQEDLPCLQYEQGVQFFLSLWQQKDPILEPFWAIGEEQSLDYAHVFSSYLLAPETFLRRACQNGAFMSSDIVSDLSQVFQVSKVLMGYRLKRVLSA